MQPGKNGPYQAIDPKVRAREEQVRKEIKCDRLIGAAHKALRILDTIPTTSYWREVDAARSALKEALK